MISSVPDKVKVPATLWEGLKRAKVDRAEVIRRANLPLGVLKYDAPISTTQFFALWRAIEAVSEHSAIGLRIATGLDGAVMPLAFVAAQHARTFRDALNRVARFKRLCAPEEVDIKDVADRCELIIRWPHGASDSVPHALVDATMVSFVELGRRGTGEHLAPVLVELARPAASRGGLEKYFGCSITFDAKADRIAFLREDLDKLFATYNKDLLDVLAPELNRRLEHHDASESVTEQTKWVIRRRLTAGRPDIRSVAAELAMSERSLQRRLTDEGVSFQSLVSQTRHQMALEHLADSSLSLIEVAYLLGYEDQNSFFRAFRQWEDKTPSEWRAANLIANQTEREANR